MECLVIHGREKGATLFEASILLLGPSDSSMQEEKNAEVGTEDHQSDDKESSGVVVVGVEMQKRISAVVLLWSSFSFFYSDQCIMILVK